MKEFLEPELTPHTDHSFILSRESMASGWWWKINSPLLAKALHSSWTARFLVAGEIGPVSTILESFVDVPVVCFWDCFPGFGPSIDSLLCHCSRNLGTGSEKGQNLLEWKIQLLDLMYFFCFVSNLLRFVLVGGLYLRFCFKVSDNMTNNKMTFCRCPWNINILVYNTLAKVWRTHWSVHFANIVLSPARTRLVVIPIGIILSL